MLDSTTRDLVKHIIKIVYKGFNVCRALISVSSLSETLRENHSIHCATGDQISKRVPTYQHLFFMMTQQRALMCGIGNMYFLFP